MNRKLEAAIHRVKRAKASAPAPKAQAASMQPGRRALDWQAALRAMTTEALADLAADRGVTVAPLEWLWRQGLLGLHDGLPAFALHDDRGSVVGCHHKTVRGWQWLKPEETPIGPLILGDLQAASFVIACESQWDAIAVADKMGGFEAGAAFICTRGAGNGAMVGKVTLPPRAKLVLMPQNDAPRADGVVPSEEWYKAAKKSLPPNKTVYRTQVPVAHKDANDWVRAGATAQEVADMLIQATHAAVAAMRVRPIVEFSERPIDEGATLLGNRYLCREGSMLFIGPSGVGKSSASVQQDICWGLGLEAFGIKPARPLKILTIQAENDDGDMTEMARGVLDGLGLGREQREFLRRQVIYATVKTKTGKDFIEQTLAPLLDAYRPDLVRIDPFQSYLGDDFKEARALLEFCQAGLNPLLEQYQCGCILNHHTPKTSNRDTTSWKATDWMYAGAGSAQLTNWARAVMVVDSTKVPGLFKFIAAKRGSRLGWEDGLERHFAHSREPGKIVWEEPDVMDILEAQTPPPNLKKRNKGKSSGAGGGGGGSDTWSSHGAGHGGRGRGAAADEDYADSGPACTPGAEARSTADEPSEAQACAQRRRDCLKLLQGWPMTTVTWEKKAAFNHLSRATFYRFHKEYQTRGLIRLEEKVWKLTEKGLAEVEG